MYRSEGGGRRDEARQLAGEVAENERSMLGVEGMNVKSETRVEEA